MDLKKLALQIIEEWKVQQKDQEAYIQGKYDGLMEFLQVVGKENAKGTSNNDNIVSDKETGSGES